jgi:hypothetical protein
MICNGNRMDAYKYGHAPRKHTLRYVLIIFLSAGAIVGGLAGLVIWINSRPSHNTVPGTTVTVPQKTANTARTTFDEPLYSFKLPSDWKIIGTKPNSITWQATIKNADNRTLTIYTDVIPTDQAVNRELPLMADGDQLKFGELSDNCANFTPGGTLDTGKAAKLKPVQSVWQGVNFICNLPQVVDNQVGTGSAAGINTVTVTGPSKGTHSYFFLYIDRNIQPDYTILYGALQTFRAK